MNNNIGARNAPTVGIASANIRFAADRSVPMTSSAPSLRVSNRSSSRPSVPVSSEATPRPRFRGNLMIRNLQKLFTVITLSVLAQVSLFGQTESTIKNVFWQPNELQPGSVIFFTVELNREATKVSGQFLSKELLFFYSGKAGI